MAAAPRSLLRKQPRFWEHVTACIPQTSSEPPSRCSGNCDPGAEGVSKLINIWGNREPVAWHLIAEAYAMTVLAIEAFSQPRASGLHYAVMHWRASGFTV